MDGSIHGLLDAAVRAGLCPGCVAGWSSESEGTIVFESAGTSHIGGNGIQAGPNTWYDLASLTKPLVVTTLFLLARRGGALELGRGVGDILPNAGPYREATVENLLTHTAGLPGWAPLYASGHSPDDIVAGIRALEPVGLPGGQVEYSCPGFILLGLILEEVFSLDLAEAFAELVAGPLRLKDGLSFDPLAPGRLTAGGAVEPDAENFLVRSLGLDPSKIPPCGAWQPDDGNARFLGGVAGNSGLFGTIFGVVQLGREYLSGGGLLLDAEESDLAAQCRTPRLEWPRGLGWQIGTSPGCSAGPALSPTSIGHVGFTGTSLWIDRQQGCVMALLSNRHHPAHRGIDLHPLRRRFNTLVSGSQLPAISYQLSAISPCCPLRGPG